MHQVFKCLKIICFDTDRLSFGQLNMLLKALVKWCGSENEDPSSCEQSYQRMLTQVKKNID